MSGLLEVRALRALAERPELQDVEGTLVARGVAIPYGDHSRPISRPGRNAVPFVERILPGAVRKHLTRSRTNVRAVRGHYDYPTLASQAAGTLRLFDNDARLAYEIDLTDDWEGQLAAAALERGETQGASIGFRAVSAAETWTVLEDGTPLRTIAEIDVLDHIELSRRPYYTGTSAELAVRTAPGAPLVTVTPAKRPVVARPPVTSTPRPDRAGVPSHRPLSRPRIAWLYA